MPDTSPGHSETKIESFLLQANDWVPNNTRLPVIVYRDAITAGQCSALAFERMFKANDWPPQWRDGVFAYHHYHSTTHEVLGFAQGWARLVLGGPGGQKVRVSCGDAVLLPAGTGHFQAEASPNLLVIGAYPSGQSFDICRGAPSNAARRRIVEAILPSRDPIDGRNGALLELWRG